MSQKNYNAFGVPHYANSETPPVRPKPPRELPDWIIKEKIKRSKALQWIYKWIRANWKEGDRLQIRDYVDSPTRVLNNRIGRFVRKNHVDQIVVDWIDNGHKLILGAVEFYHYAIKIDSEGNELETKSPEN